MTDEEIKRLIDYIDAISSFAIEEYLKEKNLNNSAQKLVNQLIFKIIYVYLAQTQNNMKKY